MFSAHIPVQTTSERQSMYKRLLPSHLLPRSHGGDSTSAVTPPITPNPRATPLPSRPGDIFPPIHLPGRMSPEEFTRALEAVPLASGQVPPAIAPSRAVRNDGAASVVSADATQRGTAEHNISQSHALHVKEHSKVEADADHDEGAGGHDAPNWSRMKSASVLMICTALYAMIAGQCAAGLSRKPLFHPKC